MSGLAAMRKELADVRGQQAALAQRARKLERMIEEAVSRMRDQEGAGAAAPSNVMSYNYKGRIVYSNAQPPSSAEDSDGSGGSVKLRPSASGPSTRMGVAIPEQSADAACRKCIFVQTWSRLGSWLRAAVRTHEGRSVPRACGEAVLRCKHGQVLQVLRLNESVPIPTRCDLSTPGRRGTSRGTSLARTRRTPRDPHSPRKLCSPSTLHAKPKSAILMGDFSSLFARRKFSAQPHIHTHMLFY